MARPRVLHATIAMALTAASLLGCQGGDSQSSWTSISGYWEGRFMPESGLDLVLVLDFGASEPSRARVLLWQDGTHVQDDPLSRISLHGDSLSFVIAAKSTRFDGLVDRSAQEITGMLLFPDRSEHAVHVKKITWPSLMNRAEDSGELDLATLDADGAKGDLDILFEVLDQNHPGPYRFIERDLLIEAFESARQRLDEPINRIEFLRLVAPLVAAIRCSHTDVRLPEEAMERLRRRRQNLPVELRLEDEYLIVVDASSSIPVGSQIISINDLVVDLMISDMLSAMPHDGNNETYPRFVLNHSFAEVYATRIQQANVFRIEFVDPDGELREQSLSGAELEAPPSPGRVIGFELPDDATDAAAEPAVLTIAAFIDTKGESFESTIAEVFGTLDREGIGKLIIDLRGNTGGYPPLAAYLLSYLIDEPFVYFALDPDPPDEFASLYEPIGPQQPGFGGRVVFLINGANISTAGHFVSLVKTHELGPLVGEETGGSFRTNSNGRVVTLPESGLEVNIPTRTFTAAAEGLPDDRGVQPDIAVSPTVVDFLSGRDPGMEAARAWVEAAGR